MKSADPGNARSIKYIEWNNRCKRKRLHSEELKVKRKTFTTSGTYKTYLPQLNELR